MIQIFILGFLVLLYVAMPFWIQFIITIINTWIADPIPFIDEIIMYGTLVGKITKALNVIEKISVYRAWCKKHRFLSIIIAIGFFAVLSFGIWKICAWLF